MTNGPMTSFRTRITLSPQIPGLHVGGDGATYVGDRSSLRRVGGTASHPIELAVMLSMAIPFALHFARNAPATGRARWG